MTPSPQTRLGPYEIESLLGAGGMGEVYRARDTRLGRDVAIKVLPVDVAGDPSRLHRFQQEARAAAALNHPNIVSVHDIGTEGSTTYVVSELLQGQTLREALSGGALPVRKTVDYAVQIATGLAAAHEKGIVHRDLKPENIFLTSDGRAKILDFGLAKLVEDRPADASRFGIGGTMMPTTPMGTAAGMIVGTIGYMAPEQVRGLAVDHRADIFAFGAILYELLTGARAFAGHTPADTMSAILKEDPPLLSNVDKIGNAAVQRIVQRCLEKTPDQRFHSAHDLAFALQSLGTASGVAAERPATAAGAAATGRHWRLLAVSAAALLLVALPFVIAHVRERPSMPIRVQFSIEPPAGSVLPTPQGRLAVSPDGRKIVFAVRLQQDVHLVVRDIGTGTLAVVPGSDGVTSPPFWSPDSRSIALVVAGKLKRVDIDTGASQPICDMPLVLTGSPTANAPGAAASGTWGTEGTILFAVGSSAAGTAQPLFRVPASGGRATPATTLDASQGDVEHALPDFLPDGQHFIFLVRRKSKPPAVYVGSLAGSHRTLLVENVVKALFSAPGHLVYVREGVLYVQSLDTSTFALTGTPVAITNDVQVTGGSTRGAFSVSHTGLVIFENRRPVQSGQFTWYDRAGRELGTLGPPGPYMDNFSVTRDGQRLAFVRARDVWTYDVRLGTTARITADPAGSNDPVWSPDGRRLLFSSTRRGTADIFVKTYEEMAPEDVLVGSDDGAEYPDDWSSNGRFVALMQGPAATPTHISVLSLADRKIVSVTTGTFRPEEPHFSPDSKWLAYNSDESGAAEVYIVPFPPTGRKWVVSTSGGMQPRWRRDGGEIFYLSPSGMFMGVALDRATATPTGAPKPLFQSGISLVSDTNDQYDLTADGRFLVLKPVGPPPPGTITVIVNALSLSR